MRRLVIAIILMANGLMGFAQIRLPKLIGNGMILQRNQKVKLWGWAAPKEKVLLSFLGKHYSNIASTEGKWAIELPAQTAGGPYVMKFSGSNEIDITDVRFGDVWICSGQSNMELSMDRVKDKYPKVISSANNPAIRQFLVPDKYNFQNEADDVDAGEWKAADQSGILSFTAVGYFFAMDLYERYKVPIGLINAALGGSPADAWISESALKKFPDSYAELQRFKDQDLINKIEAGDKKTSQDWYQLANRTDIGLSQHWSAATIDDSNWGEMNVPGFWADNGIGNVNGVVWFRKEIIVPQTMVGKPARLFLGRIVDSDSVFVNGTFTGTTGYQYPPRKYVIPNGLLHEGKNMIAVRVINNSGRGGFVPDKVYQILGQTDSISLIGKWKFKLGARMDALPGSVVIRFKPAGLYNAMIAPVLNYKVKGVIWYQGESNAGAPGNYQDLMTVLINDWRTRWQSPDMPFLFVQLANFMETKSTPEESNWAALRMAQFKTLEVPKTGMAITIDIGEWNDIHPLNKYDVGHRLALLAMREAYHDKKITASGPLFKSVLRKGDALEISFTSVGKGLTSLNSDKLRYFSIAGADGKFVWAKASLKGDKVIVESPEVHTPVSVRYAWADNPEGANLFNKDGLPASPFEGHVTN